MNECVRACSLSPPAILGICRVRPRRSQKSKLWEPKGLNERAARRGRKERRNSEVVNFTCVCTGGRRRTRTAIERSFSHRESFSAVIFGSLSALASI